MLAIEVYEEEDMEVSAQRQESFQGQHSRDFFLIRRIKHLNEVFGFVKNYFSAIYLLTMKLSYFKCMFDYGYEHDHGNFA